jgi:hypothetical protein
MMMVLSVEHLEPVADGIDFDEASVSTANRLIEPGLPEPFILVITLRVGGDHRDLLGHGVPSRRPWRERAHREVAVGPGCLPADSGAGFGCMKAHSCGRLLARLTLGCRCILRRISARVPMVTVPI